MHTYKRNGIEFYLLAGVGHHRAISLICLEGHSKSVIECEICNEVFPASRSLTILENLSDLLVVFKDLIIKAFHAYHFLFFFL